MLRKGEMKIRRDDRSIELVGKEKLSLLLHFPASVGVRRIILKDILGYNPVGKVIYLFTILSL
jgi:hypothetical protein